MSGRLILVATPIGNLEDCSLRVRRSLEESNLCLAEDTRRTGRLLQHLGIRVPMSSYHEHNEEKKRPGIVEALKEGKTIALVSDAGTPLISDPGYTLVRECRREGIPVEAVPGPSAVITALILSGFPPHPFTFAGFPPVKKGKRMTFWRKWLENPWTLIFFSTPHAIVRHLKEIGEIVPVRELFIAREMTKLHEEHLTGTPSQLAALLAERPRIKGEITLVIGPIP